MSHDKIANTFDQWAKTGRAEAMEKEHGDRGEQVIAQLGIRAGEQILDLGCGNGWATRLLAKSAPGAGAVGVDVSPAMIARAEELHSLTIRARYEVMPFEQLSFRDNHFARIFSMEALYYAHDLPAALRESCRVLKPGGTIDVLVDYFEESPATAVWREVVGLNMHRLSESGWRSMFEAAGMTAVVLRRVLDRRGPGEAQGFKPSECTPDWPAHLHQQAAGSLWIHAEKPKL